MENTKQVSRKELLQYAFFKLLKTKKEDAALTLSSKLINQDLSGSSNVYFADSTPELEAIQALNYLLEGKSFGDLCNIERSGRFIYRIEGADVIINTKRYEENI